MKTILKYIFSFALGSTMLTSCDLDTIPTPTPAMEQCYVQMTQWVLM